MDNTLILLEIKEGINFSNYILKINYKINIGTFNLSAGALLCISRAGACRTLYNKMVFIYI